MIKKLDVLAITESWLHDGDIDQLPQKKMTPLGYKFEHLPRKTKQGDGKTKRGGGVAVICKNEIKLTKTTVEDFTTFEYLDAEIQHANELVRLIVIYRPPNNQLSNKFLEEFGNLTDLLVISKGKPLIVGDFNYHIDIVSNAGDSQAKKRAASLLSQLEAANFIQHVKGPTHKHGHTLDLVISRKSELGISNVHCDMSVPSDHYAVIFDLSIPKPQRPRKEITVRNWKKINTISLKEDLRQATLPITNCTSVSEAVQKYNQVLTDVIEKHALSSKRTITVRQDSPWFNTDIKAAKQK